MDTMLSPVGHFNLLHAVVGSALVLALSVVYWIRTLTLYRTKSRKPDCRPFPTPSRQQTQPQQPVSRNGAKKLAPVADSVW